MEASSRTASPSVRRMEPRDPHPVTGELFASPVPPGSGWPGDPADADTPVATDARGGASVGRVVRG